MKQLRVQVSGDVIGVGFRAWTKIQAKNIGVTGWVRNVGNRVEAVIQGEEKKVDQMVELLKKGPSVSRVEKLDVFEEKISDLFDGFEINK